MWSKHPVIGSYSCIAHLSVQLTSLWWNNYVESMMMCCFKSAIADGLLFCLLWLKKVQRMCNQYEQTSGPSGRRSDVPDFLQQPDWNIWRGRTSVSWKQKVKPKFCPVQTPHLSWEMLFLCARGAWAVPGQLLREGSDPSCSTPGLVTDLPNLGLLNICICFTQTAPLPVDLSWLFYLTGFTPFGLDGPSCCTCLP